MAYRCAPLPFFEHFPLPPFFRHDKTAGSRTVMINRKKQELQISFPGATDRERDHCPICRHAETFVGLNDIDVIVKYREATSKVDFEDWILKDTSLQLASETHTDRRRLAIELDQHPRDG